MELFFSSDLSLPKSRVASAAKPFPTMLFLISSTLSTKIVIKRPMADSWFASKPPSDVATRTETSSSVGPVSGRARQTPICVFGPLMRAAAYVQQFVLACCERYEIVRSVVRCFLVIVMDMDFGVGDAGDESVLKRPNAIGDFLVNVAIIDKCRAYRFGLWVTLGFYSLLRFAPCDLSTVARYVVSSINGLVSLAFIHSGSWVNPIANNDAAATSTDVFFSIWTHVDDLDRGFNPCR